MGSDLPEITQELDPQKWLGITFWFEHTDDGTALHGMTLSRPDFLDEVPAIRWPVVFYPGKLEDEHGK